ncbi:retrovirus-related pol polyprotein from transposon TNT 1-94 [Tanacetum coccineum]|uniref:Retrovirus-related pol polyprotein from transposon TNT 1-94 n=1 Tax=Tanacetum coccineum TaxID=301880 RepID=A0ABQ5H2J6_9ASTR
MTTLAEFMILSSGDNRLPMLDKDLYDSWQSRMELYMENREHGRMILESVKHGPLIWPTIKENGVTRTNKYVELSVTEKIQADYDVKATNIILQGLTSDVYALVNHHKIAKDLWERIQLLMQGTSLTKQEREFNQQTHLAEFPQIDSGLAVPVFNSFAAGTSRTRANISGIGGNNLGKVLNEEELAFLADPGVAEGLVTQTVITHNATYQANDLDAYDSECDEISTAKAVLKANLSSYGSDVLSEYLLETQNAAVQDTISSTQQDAMILSVFEQLSNQVTNCNKVNKENLMANESLSTELERYKERVKLLEERQNSSSSSEEPSTSSIPVKTSVPKELPKERTTPTTITEVQTVFNHMEQAVEQCRLETKSSEIQMREDLNENDRLLDQIISQDIVNIVVNSSVDINDSVNVNVNSMITATNEVPFMEPVPLEVVTQEPVVTKVYTMRPKVPKTIGSNRKLKIAKSMISNKTEPDEKILKKTGDRSQLTNFVHKFLGTVKFGNNQVAKTMGYGDYKIGNVTILRVYYLEGLGHNLFSVGQFWDSDLEVAFRKHSCFVRNLEGVDLLLRSRETNLYTLSIGDMMASSLICLLSKASKTKSWFWHRRLSHLNFGAINHLAKNGLVRGLPKLKFEKDHLCAASAMGKSKKQSHKPKSEDINQEKLYLLHMDLCGPMRVASVNGKKYILIVGDDYSRFTWVKFLASKDEAPDFIIKFLKMIQVRLNTTVRNIRTDNGTEFINQTLSSYYESVSIYHQISIARTP